MTGSKIRFKFTSISYVFRTLHYILYVFLVSGDGMGMWKMSDIAVGSNLILENTKKRFLFREGLYRKKKVKYTDAVDQEREIV